MHFSIFAQVNITNPTRWLVKFDVISCYIHLKTEIFKMAAARFVEVYWQRYKRNSNKFSLKKTQNLV
jgi:hypothetical protein